MQYIDREEFTRETAFACDLSDEKLAKMRGVQLLILPHMENNVASKVFGMVVQNEVLVAGEGFEPSKSMTTDLQSAPFGRSGTPPGV